METQLVEQLRAALSRLRLAAAIAVLAHLIAGVTMVVILRNGLQTNPDLISRLRYLTDHNMLWVGSWLTWHLAALSMLSFCLCFNRAHEARGAIGVVGRMAVFVCAVGVALDLAAQAAELGVMPGLARAALDVEHPEHAMQAQQFLVLDRAAVVLTGYVANSLYVLATLLLISISYRFYPRWVVLAGISVGISGTGLSAAALTNSTFSESGSLDPSAMTALAPRPKARSIGPSSVTWSS